MINHWKGKLWYAYGTSMTSVKQGEYVPVVEKRSGLMDQAQVTLKKQL